jgi:hypothetical protein
MYPSPAAIAAIQAKVASLPGGWSAYTDVQLAADSGPLNTPSVANPNPQGAVPNPIGESALIPLLDDPNNGSLAKLQNYVNLALVKADIDSGNRAGVLLWAQKLPLVGVITTGEAENITSYVNGTMPDPNWTAEISWAVANIFRPVDTSDVAAARPGA